MKRIQNGIPTELPIIGLDSSIMVYPGITTLIDEQDPETISDFIEKVGIDATPSLAILVMVDPKIHELPDKFYKVGTVSEINFDLKERNISFKGLYRAEILDFQKSTKEEGKTHYFASIKYLHDESCDEYFVSSESAIRAVLFVIRKLLLSYIKELIQINYPIGNLGNMAQSMKDLDHKDKDAVDQTIWATLYHMPAEVRAEERQPFLDSNSLIERIELLRKLLDKHLRITVLIREDLENVSKKSRTQLLPGSIQKPKKETGQKNGDGSDDDDNDEKFKECHRDIQRIWAKFKAVREFMNEDARRVAMDDLDKLLAFQSPQGNSYEWSKFKGRLGTLVELPWGVETVQETDIERVMRVLDEDHYGLEHVKDNICDHVSPKMLNPEGKGQIICLLGPPGVGKTSLGKSIARALNRPFIRHSLGGARDESQIRGHDITYVSAQPGDIIRAMKKCGYRNPVFMLDEIDKVGQMTPMGDLSAAMLEVLDPEQNNSFKDRYLDAPFDLSHVMFIATGNVEEDILPALRDRMDIIRLPGYTEDEKIEIAKQYLVPRWMKEVGLTSNNIEVVWREEIIPQIIRGHTSEAGVRNLERTLATVLRKIGREHLKSKGEGNPKNKFEITEQKVYEFLGPAKFLKERAQPTEIGEAIGLAWTPVGGDLLYVQAEMYPRLKDKKVFARTGMQGNIMKESDEVALTLLRNHIGNKNHDWIKKLNENAIHLHIPDGAVPKDGPSAGITIFTALYSEVTDKKVKPYLAMTGEIDIKGKVKPVGGIREKIVAAERAGIKEIVMPKENERNLHDVSSTVKEKLTFHFVRTVEEVLAIAFPDPV